jgi:hypothetical protein
MLRAMLYALADTSQRVVSGSASGRAVQRVCWLVRVSGAQHRDDCCGASAPPHPAAARGTPPVNSAIGPRRNDGRTQASVRLAR